MGKGFLGKALLVVALCAMAALLVACGSAAGAGGGGEIRLEKQDSGKQIELQPGQALVIVLDSNPTTGYSWFYSTGDEAVIRQVGETEFQQQPAGQNVVGAGGQETLRFEAQQAGTTTLELVHHRPWEKDVEPLERFTVEVVVK